MGDTIDLIVVNQLLYVAIVCRPMDAGATCSLSNGVARIDDGLI